jgi:hypothetical protein
MSLEPPAQTITWLGSDSHFTHDEVQFMLQLLGSKKRTDKQTDTDKRIGGT